jgi:predicted dehydrogenase
METSMTNKLGIAVLGCGYWGVNYVRVFRELTDTRLVVICDENESRLADVGRRFPGVRLTTDVSEVLRTEEVDAIVICTPASTHVAAALPCLRAGKHLLIEKPITTVASDADMLVTEASRRGLTLMTGHTFLYNPAVRKIKGYVDEAALGRIYYLYARRTNLGPIRRDVNALWDLAPHDISIFNYWLGCNPEWVSAVGTKVLSKHREDVGFVSLGYPGGIVGHIHVSWADPHKEREVVIVGSERRVVFNDLNAPEQVRVFDKGVAPAPEEADSYGENLFLMRDGDITSPHIEVGEPLKLQCSHFVECVRQGRQPLTDGRAGMEVVQVMEAIDRSVASNGTPIQVGKERWV